MSRLDKLKEQHQDLNINLIDLLAKADPSGSYKYLPFLIKTFKSNFTTEGDILRHMFQRDNLISLTKFEEHMKHNRIKNNDISTYSSFKQIKDEVEEADELLRIKELEKQVKKIYSNDEWLVLIPLSYESAKMYGANTKWCVTQREYWDKYLKDYKIIYIINKKTDVKWAISSKDSEDLIEGWQSDDHTISPFMIPIPSSILAIITDEIRERESISEMSEYKVLHPKDETWVTWDYNGRNISQLHEVQDSYGDFINAANSMDVQHILSLFGKLGMGGQQ
jgi:hypothetical protein